MSLHSRYTPEANRYAAHRVVPRRPSVQDRACEFLGALLATLACLSPLLWALVAR